MISTRKERLGWYLYDFAVSGFTTSVITVFIGPYLTNIAQNASVDGYLYLLGIPIKDASFFTYVISFSVILQVFILPLIGALADYSNIKKELLGFFAYVGAAATIGMYFLEGDRYLLGGILLVISNLAMGASIVVYNAFLSQIAEENERDKVSSIGYSWGYMGGGSLLAIHLVLLMFAEDIGISTGFALRIALMSAGFWWALFTIFPLIRLKKRRPVKSIPDNKNIFSIGFTQFFRTLKEARKYPKTLFFLLTFLLYNDGVQTVILVAAPFGQEALGMDIQTLTIVILMVQFIAFGGAYLFGWLAKVLNTKRALELSLVIWCICILYAYFFLNSEIGFFFLAGGIAIVLGGTQALSRSLFSMLIPDGKEAEYFSLYEISERGTSWIGPLIFGLSLQWFDDYKLAILSLIIFFISGLALLFGFNFKKAIIESGNKVPDYD
jgi:UMF1 family MFS transporter